MDYEIARANMLKQQIQASKVLDQKVLELVAVTPREHFVPDQYRSLAYADLAIPLKNGMTLYTPGEEAFILQALKVKQDDTVLEVGSGSGYMTVLLSKLAKHVYSIDIDPSITQDVGRKLAQLNVNNVTLHTGDAGSGWDRHAPYSIVLLNGSLPKLPLSLRNNLAVGGRLFGVLGRPPAMQATLIKRTTQDIWDIKVLFETKIDRLFNPTETLSLPDCPR